MPSRQADVLILGAGLAGLRAALSCLAAAPGLEVAVASLAAGPSGSSFSNLNDALGIHAPQGDDERADYLREVTSLNRGAFLDQRLLAIQAEEAWDRLRDLAGLGLPFASEPDGTLVRHPSCFSPHSRRAYVFNGLAQAHACFKRRLDAMGCRFLSGCHVAGLAGSDGEASPAALLVPMGGEPEQIAAKAVIVALGGPARLFAHSMAGPNPGYAHGLLMEAGARMANLGYLQFMWGTVPEKHFWQPGETGSGEWRGAVPGTGDASEGDTPGGSPPGYGAEVIAHHGDTQRLPSAPSRPLADLIPDLRNAAASRTGHCPFGYGLDDSILDLTLADFMDEYGVATLIKPDGTPLRVAPMAHASNGGAVIDEHARTSLPGVFAAGECATGMHGANRLGGGMVLATQVFGHRAGVEAARLASRTQSVTGGNASLKEKAAGLVTDEAERAAGLSWLGAGLSRHAVLGGRPGHEAFARAVRARLDTARDWRLRLSLLAATGILDALPVPANPDCFG